MTDQARPTIAFCSKCIRTVEPRLGDTDDHGMAPVYCSKCGKHLGSWGWNSHLIYPLRKER